MPIRRVLVDCAVLSLHDTCVVYPSCKGCFSRIIVHQTDTARCRCSKCGYSCLKEQVDYRYRLSLKVSRNHYIFGVTVFGSCLNPFFGISASGLQRLVEESEGLHGTHSQATLLIKAIEDCFIGRHFVFGIKVADSDRLLSPLFSPHPPLVGSSKEEGHFIASQITLPCAAAPGCSVVSYYRGLLQHAVVMADSCAASRSPPPSLFLQPSPPCSINSTLPSCLRSPSQHLDNSLTPTPPWQQSLGLVTSSAEQDESCSFGGDGGELMASQKHVCQSVGVEESFANKVAPLSSPCYLEQSSWDKNSFWNLAPSFSGSPVHRSVIHTPTTHRWFAPSEPVHCGNQPVSTRVRGVSDREEHVEENSKSLSDSVAWEDMPFSESLGEFVYGAAGESDRFDKMESNLVKKNREINNITSHEPCLGAKKSLGDSFDSSPSTVTPSDRTLLDVTNTALHTPYRRYEEDGEDQLGACDDEYNCSVDLFDCSQISTNTQMLEKDFDPKAGPHALGLDVNRDLDISEGSHSLDFVPFSQTDDMVKKLGSVEEPSFRASRCTLTTRTHIKNRQAPNSDGSRHIPKAHTRTTWKLDSRQYVLARQRLMLQKRTPEGTKKKKRESGSVCDMSPSTCDIDTEIPPTCKAQRWVRLRQKTYLGRDHCKRALQDRATAHQQNHSRLKLRQIRNYEVIMDREKVGCSERQGSHEKTSATEVGLSQLVNSSPHAETEACDLSRDLFSDSF